MKRLKKVHNLVPFRKDLWLALVLGGFVLFGCNPKKKVQKYAYQWKRETPTKTPPKQVVKEEPKEEVEISEATGKASIKGVNTSTLGVLRKAKSYLGTPYKFGGTSKNGMDCSGLTYTAWSSAGVTLPRSSRDQYQSGTKVSRKELKPGDLVFFSAYKNGKIDHVGMVTTAKSGSISFIHATVSKGVREDRLDVGYWADRFMGARRVD